jgi:hypothetical protein
MWDEKFYIVLTFLHFPLRFIECTVLTLQVHVLRTRRSYRTWHRGYHRLVWPILNNLLPATLLNGIHMVNDHTFELPTPIRIEIIFHQISSVFLFILRPPQCLCQLSGWAKISSWGKSLNGFHKTWPDFISQHSLIVRLSSL